MQRWQLQLRACLSSVRLATDPLFDGGAMPRLAFRDLLRSLAPEQLVSLGWLAFADAAVWPQLPSRANDALLASFNAQPRPMADALPPGDRDLDVALQQLSNFLSQAFERQVRSAGTSVDGAPLLGAVDRLANASERPSAYWSSWLKRVVSAGAVTPSLQARQLAIGSLRGRLNTPDSFDYEAVAGDGDASVSVFIVVPKRGGQLQKRLGVFAGVQPEGRTIRATFAPDRPIDTYRMSYLFRTTVLSEFFQDHYEARYDTVELVNSGTGESVSYAASI